MTPLLFAKTPKFVTWLFPKRIWVFSRSSNTVYLTFDDGPIPEITPWVLEQLKSHNAKATFFCIGENIIKNPKIFNKINSEGHSIGNHTYNHLNGNKTSTEKYLENIALFDKKLQENHPDISQTDLFRPPYGKLKSSQANRILNMNKRVVMWDVLSYDWDASVSEEQCLQNVLKHIQKGSIVVFHDSKKAEKNLRYALPKVLAYISEKGWKAEAI